MFSERWSVRSLRRFSNFEIVTNGYLIVGAVLSPVYAISAVLRTRLYEHLLSLEVLRHVDAVLMVLISIVFQSILRVILWLPQLAYGLFIEHQSLWDWLTAANIFKAFIS